MFSHFWFITGCFKVGGKPVISTESTHIAFNFASDGNLHGLVFFLLRDLVFLGSAIVRLVHTRESLGDLVLDHVLFQLFYRFVHYLVDV